jgi:diguanylate cyclase (GGDEF)-like protein
MSVDKYADIPTVSRAARPLAYLLVAVAVVTVALLGAFEVQRESAVRAGAKTETAVVALTAMLDQETGLRGFLYTGEEDYLDPYIAGQSAYQLDRRMVTQAASGDARSERLASVEDSAARNWAKYAEAAVSARRQSSAPRPYEATESLNGKRQMDLFRSTNSQLRVRLDQRRDSSLRRTGILWTAGVVVIAGLFAMFGYLVLHRSTRRTLGRSEQEVAYRNRQSEFSDLIQAVDSEAEAHELVQRHLHRSMPGSEVTVLGRNNSDNRLLAATSLPAESTLAQQLVSAEPRACLAIRLAHAHLGGSDPNQLIACGVCSHVAGTATCQPLLVGGKVIGSVLVAQPGPFGDAERRLVADTVAQAAPVLASLKTIAIAESRASTDALTGLPNRRAMNDTLKLMVAQASRTAKPLAAIAFDLDHFKAVNDRYGHEIGDAALSAVGECLRENLRESDFAARIGGEEFLILAPDTDTNGAEVLAEKLRDALLREHVPQLPEPLTASFGIAVIPAHAASGDILLRRADRASYLAKERGRNRVEVANSEDSIPAVLHTVQDLRRDGSS